jgi:RNA polymerase sigma factor (sigma-70 family)
MHRPFEQIVAEHGPTVLRVCRAVVGPVDAEDAWSETFLSAMRAYPALDAEANVAAWLVTIAHRKAIDLARARARRPLAVADPPEPTSRTPAPAGAGEVGDGDVWDAVRALPDRQRTSIAYHYLAGLPYRDIAAITGGTEAAARRAAADGLKNLRTGYPPATSTSGVTR